MFVTSEYHKGRSAEVKDKSFCLIVSQNHSAFKIKKIFFAKH
jgi:hypothetical protein